MSLSDEVQKSGALNAHQTQMVCSLSDILFVGWGHASGGFFRLETHSLIGKVGVFLSSSKRALDGVAPFASVAR